MIKQLDGTITHVGLVISYGFSETHHGEIREDYLNVFNPQTEQIEQVTIGFYCQGKYQANLAYTIDLLPQYKAILDAKREARKAEIEARTIRIGKQVKVTLGRNKGLTGMVFWIGKDKFNAGDRIGLDTVKGKIFVNEFNVEILVTKLEKALA